MPELQKRLHTLFTAVERELFNPNTKKDAALVNALQRKPNDVLDIVCMLPLYRNLQIDWEFGRNLLPNTFNNETEMFKRLCDPSSAEAAV